MLSALKLEATITEAEKPPVVIKWGIDALTLLSYLQQAWPGVDSATPGAGSKAAPYQPKTAKQWFYTAKVKGSGSTAKRFPVLTSGKAWIKTGGRMIGIDPANLYASDHGLDGDAAQLENPTYPNLKSMIGTWKSGDLANTDARLTEKLRTMLEGKGLAAMPDFLPVLGTVLMVSEVARNHTAFHTNLMAMDLIQLGAELPSGSGFIPWTWQSAIWLEDACPKCAATGSLTCATCSGAGHAGMAPCPRCRGARMVGGKGCRSCSYTGWFKRNVRCKTCNGSGWFKVPVACGICAASGSVRTACGDCAGRGSTTCDFCKGVGRGTVYDEAKAKGLTGTTFSGGAEWLQNGLLPMSHKGSALGSAFDLSGEGLYHYVRGGSTDKAAVASALTVVRRKEATILIHWLQNILDKGRFSLGDKEVEVSAAVHAGSLDTADVDFGKAYDDLSQIPVKDASRVAPALEGTDEAKVKAVMVSRILTYCQLRSEVLWYAFDAG